MKNILDTSVKKKYRKRVFERFIAQERDRTKIVL